MRIRTLHRRSWFFSASAALAIAISVTRAEPASQPDATSAKALQQYAELFGAEDHRASEGSSLEQAKFAKRLLEAAKGLKDDPGLLKVIWERAYALGCKDADGYAAAGDALHQLNEAQAEPAASLVAKSIALDRLRYRHSSGPAHAEAGRGLLDGLIDDGNGLMADGQILEALKRFNEASTVAIAIHSPMVDEVNVSIRQARERVHVQEKLQKILSELSASPDALKAREAARLYMLGLDMPREVATVPGMAGASPMSQMAALAAQDDSLSEEDLVRLAEWYQSQVTGADENGRSIAYGRALKYYRRFLDLHEKQDADRLKISNQVAKLHERMDAMGGSSPTADKVVLWNTHNAGANDRGSLVISLLLLRDGQVVWEKDDVPMPWEIGRDLSTTIDLPPRKFDTVRIEITKWRLHGGGLTEIQVFKDGQNIAAGAQTKVSSVFIPKLGGQCLTDGILKSDVANTGYWLPAEAKPAWAEVSLSKAPAPRMTTTR